jgi:hypothetical protein
MELVCTPSHLTCSPYAYSHALNMELICTPSHLTWSPYAYSHAPNMQLVCTPSHLAWSPYVYSHAQKFGANMHTQSPNMESICRYQGTYYGISIHTHRHLIWSTYRYCTGYLLAILHASARILRSDIGWDPHSTVHQTKKVSKCRNRTC